MAKKDLRKEIVKALEGKGERCPNCKSKNISASNYFWNFRCNNCGGRFDKPY
jgi:DNA-directed RNA polymerase subunit RPC12/RpoP